MIFIFMFMYSYSCVRCINGKSFLRAGVNVSVDG